jgi:hypothetical protein
VRACVCVRVSVWVWVHGRGRVVLLNPYATRRRRVVCGPSGFTTFFDIISQTVRFSKKKKKLLNTECVFRYSLQILSQTFLILRIIQRDIVINMKSSSCKVAVIFV